MIGIEMDSLWAPVARKFFSHLPQEPSSRGWQPYAALDIALGTDEYYKYWINHDDKPMSPQLKSILELLITSDHAYALLRAYQVKHGIQPHEHKIQASGK